MKSYSDQALEMKLSLEAGLIGVKDIVDWTDNVLVEVKYDDDLANVSLAKNSSPKNMLPLLNRLIGEQEEWPAARRVMVQMYETLLKHPERSRDFVRFLEQFWVRHNYSVPEDMGFIAGIDDEFTLAEQGVYGTVESATESLIANLRRIKEDAEQPS